jgi:hypothetical protein
VIRTSVAAAVVLLAAGCGGADDSPEASTPSVSAKCTAAFADQAAHYSANLPESYVEATLTVCSSAEEWLAAARANPDALGLTSSSAVSSVDLQAACAGHPETTVCKGAER